MSLFLLQGYRKPGNFWKMSFWYRKVAVVALVVGSVLLPSLLFGNAPQVTEDWAKWQPARNLYDAGRLEEALQALQSQPTDDASYFYNIGTIYYRLGKIGAGVAYLEKANRLSPHDPSTQHNLRIARTALNRSIGGDRADPASSWTETIADQLYLDEIRGAIGLLGLILALAWTRAYLRTRSLKKTLFQPAGVFGMLGLAITAGLYGAQRLADLHPPAIAVERQTVRSGPGDHFTELAQLEAGTKVRLLGPTATSNPVQSSSVSGEVGASHSGESSAPAQQPELWKQVRYSQDHVGWVRSSQLLTL